MIWPSVLAGLLLMMLPVVQPAFAQQLPQPFTTLTVGLHAEAPLIQDLSDGWKERPGLSADVESPFYAGVIELGARIHPYRRTSPDVPGMIAGAALVGWRSVRSFGGVRLSAGPRLGLFIMHFDDDELAPNGRIEQEIGLYLTARVERPLGGGWSARLSADYGRILLSEPLETAHLSLGLARTFSTPAWIREILR